MAPEEAPVKLIKPNGGSKKMRPETDKPALNYEAAGLASPTESSQQSASSHSDGNVFGLLTWFLFSCVCAVYIGNCCGWNKPQQHQSAQ